MAKEGKKSHVPAHHGAHVPVCWYLAVESRALRHHECPAAAIWNVPKQPSLAHISAMPVQDIPTSRGMSQRMPHKSSSRQGSTAK